ncbi:MAG: hypothetical protein K6A28_05465 [Bacteroidales bacterium]|nr:hypothetical protein [Bacteroidales bacterium]
MKKLVLMLGMACLFMVACNNAPKQEQPKEEPQQEAVAEEHHHCPFCTLRAEYANWENMDETAKAELNKKALELFAQMDAKKAEMEAEGKACCDKAEGAVKEGCEKAVEMTEEQKAECEARMAALKAKMDEVMAQWDNIGNMNLDDQKNLILERISAMGMGEGKCEKEGEGQHCDKPAE